MTRVFELVERDEIKGSSVFLDFEACWAPLACALGVAAGRGRVGKHPKAVITGSSSQRKSPLATDSLLQINSDIWTML